MHIKLSDISHRYGREKLFSNINLEIENGSKWAIIGNNGSGKSTFLKICASALEPNKGNVDYFYNQQPIKPEDRPKHLSICTPYMELIMDFSPKEMIEFYSKFKGLKMSNEELLENCRLSKHKNKPIKSFSSGMIQRLKLALAIHSECDLLFLDEPLSNLDEENSGWYKSQMEKFAAEKTILIASNQNEDEYFCCSQTINIQDFKA